MAARTRHHSAVLFASSWLALACLPGCADHASAFEWDCQQVLMGQVFRYSEWSGTVGWKIIGTRAVEIVGLRSSCGCLRAEPRLQNGEALTPGIYPAGTRGEAVLRVRPKCRPRSSFAEWSRRLPTCPCASASHAKWPRTPIGSWRSSGKRTAVSGRRCGCAPTRLRWAGASCRRASRSNLQLSRADLTSGANASRRARCCCRYRADRGPHQAAGSAAS